MTERNLYYFGRDEAEGDPSRKDILGGKGASLAAMSRAKLPVPPGFTISTACCRQYLDSNGRWPAGLQEDVRTAMQRLEAETGRVFGGTPPLLVSVRSGAASSMPGMMDTLLNCGLHTEMAGSIPGGFWQVYGQFVLMFGKTVAGIGVSQFEALEAEVRQARHPHGHPGKHADTHALTEEDHLAIAEKYRQLYERTAGRPFPSTPWETLWQCIEAVFRSWNNERAVTYRREHDVRGCIGTAVTVQAMFPSEISGIVFTTNPNNIEANELIIEASYGLGEAVVSGDVHPDSFVVDRTSGAIKRRLIGHKAYIVQALGSAFTQDADVASLTDDQVKELTKISLDIEAFFGSPMDIEWGRADGRFALLQSRPIRGLDILEDTELGRKEEIYRLREMAAERRKVWVTHNLGETLPAPTPLTWDIIRGFMSGNGGFGRMYRDFGYQPSDRVCETGFLELICGHVYADPERAAELFWAGMPLGYDLDALARDPKLMDAAPSRFDPERADGRFLISLPRLIRQMLACSKRMKAIRATVVERFEREVLPPYLTWVRKKRALNLTGVSTRDLVRELHERKDRVLDDFGGESLKPGFFGGIAEASLSTLLTQLLGKERGPQLAMTLTQGLDGDTTAEQATALFRVVRGGLSLEAFLERFGHRAVEEMELSRPRWREDSTYVKQILGAYLDASVGSPETMHTANAAKRHEAEALLPKLLQQCGASCLRETILTDVKDAQAMLPYRESGKFYLMMGYETIRQVLLELATRWDLGRDLFFLTLDDLESYESRREELAGIIAARKVRWQSAKRLEMPAVVDSQHLDEMGLPRQYASATELTGEPIAPGVATGTATLVFDPQKAAGLCSDYVLVCPSTDPAWTALFVHAKGLIVERGGVLSHGAIVARDFGIPAVVCPDATRRIPDKTQVRVDGNRGLITLLTESKQDGTKP